MRVFASHDLQLTRGSSPLMPDWFEEWFGEEYLSLYPHRDEDEAAQVADLIARRLHVPEASPALDLACGAGRHALPLGARWWTVGLDLSPALLRVARARDPAFPLVRAEMRELPFRDRSFALVVNLFTSFGYFREDEQHRRVIAEVGRVTLPGGFFVLDYLNAAHVRSSLVAYDEIHVGSRVVEQERSITPDGRFVVKSIMLGDEGRLFTERVRLFEPEELATMLHRCCFDVRAILGDYTGAEHSAASPRTIIIGERR